ncbi:hypothetical protein ACWEN3_16780 [Streptomyces sp. NPDC004561]
MITFPLGRAVVSATTAVVLAAGAAVACPATAVHKRHLTLTNSANGQSVTAHTGDTITVRLAGRRTATATWKWSSPTAADDEVLRKTAGRLGPNGDASATFRVTDTGRSTLDSLMRCVPKPGNVCSHAVLLWQVTVTVQ